MTAYDFVYFEGLLCIEAALLLALVAQKLSVARFTAASIIIIPLMCLFGLNARMTKISVGAMTIETKADEARTYANQIKDIRDNLIQQQSLIGKAAENLVNTNDLVQALAAKNFQAAKKIAELDQQIAKGERAISKLESASDFASTSIGAVNDDRLAFERLVGWSKDEAYPFRSEASKSVKAINSSYSTLILDYHVPWKPDVDPNKLDLDSLERMLDEFNETQDANTEINIAFMQYTARRMDFSKRARAEFLLRIMKRTTSLKVLVYTCSEFSTLTGFKDAPRTSALMYQQWWAVYVYIGFGA